MMGKHDVGLFFTRVGRVGLDLKASKVVEDGKTRHDHIGSIGSIGSVRI